MESLRRRPRERGGVGSPRIGADRPFCHYDTIGTDGYFMSEVGKGRRTLYVYDAERYATQLVLKVPGLQPTKGSGHYAVTPMIPPELRPAPTAMRDHYILWEAEWQHVPHDPLLLRRIHGSLFTVVGQWNLTSIEQQVLAGRL